MYSKHVVTHIANGEYNAIVFQNQDEHSLYISQLL